MRDTFTAGVRYLSARSHTCCNHSIRLDYCKSVALAIQLKLRPAAETAHAVTCKADRKFTNVNSIEKRQGSIVTMQKNISPKAMVIISIDLPNYSRRHLGRFWSARWRQCDVN